MAQLGWIDFSPEYRNKVSVILDLLKDEGMVDELGIGTVRDALADEFFPGISTLHTRAKYFFIVPYILRDYSLLPTQKRQNITPEKYLENTENEIVWLLGDLYDHIEGHGVIGITKRRERKETVARKPSVIYWNGINNYQFIRNNDLAITPFLRGRVKSNFETLLSELQGDDQPNDDADSEWDNIFRINITENLDWLDQLKSKRLELNNIEAEYFKDRIIQYAKDKLISQFFQDNSLFELFNNAKHFKDFANASVSTQMPQQIRKTIVLAHDFSELMYGANLMYNVLLQKKLGNNFFADEWEEWKSTLPDRMIDYKNFSIHEVFSYARTTKGFTKNISNQLDNRTFH